MKISISKCPHCGATMDWSVEGGSGSKVDFGETGTTRCSSCFKPVSNGLIEWPLLSGSDKFFATLRLIYTIIFQSFLVGVGIMFLAMLLSMVKGMEEILGVLTISSLISLPIVAFLYVRSFKREISESNKRCLRKKRIKKLFGKH